MTNLHFSFEICHQDRILALAPAKVDQQKELKIYLDLECISKDIYIHINKSSMYEPVHNRVMYIP